jgi:DNA-binding MarR family transcriptional regulator
MSEYKTKQSERKLNDAAIDCNERADSASPAVPRTSYDLRVLQSLRRIIRAVALHSRKLSMQHNVTGPQLACLLAVSGHGPLTASSLAREVHLSPSTIVGILDRLEQKGLVLRQRSSQDRRVINIAITAQGRELANSAPSPLQDTLAKALQGLPEIEQASIVLSLEKIVALMEVESLDAAPVLETGFLINTLSEEKHKP